MSTLMVTLVITFIVVSLSFVLLGISWILTGKSRLRVGMCGRVPKKKKDAGCGNEYTCGLCAKGSSEKKEEEK